MPAWALTAAGSLGKDWFAKRFAHACALMPSADFDTLIGTDCQDGITIELTETAGVADASPDFFYNASVIFIEVGDAILFPSQGVLGLTGSPSCVGDLAVKPWYMASLVRYNGPLDETNLGDTRSDMIALRSDDANGVQLGVLGDASGGSTVKWVGSVTNDSSTFTVLGPNLDGELRYWHLFESWVAGGRVHFMIDGIEFDDTIDAAELPAMPARLGMLTRRDAVGDAATVQYDKFCAVMASPRVGETS